ncbi:hypothetical protein [Arthrobacter sp. VKM Ac-2550]|uniref:hypothetical protein n=1 Tax=Crystallibacter permensis TaxID=1938888 RepID=UPI002228038E|nr:hypothetical protein [Arthrobacter sp. VKM Ac-2550]MCW2132074.1 hypothetical protein [Arthrobacter sp. VKM Ac-2550]
MDELQVSKARVRSALSARITQDIARRKRRRRVVTAAVAVPVLAGSATAGFAILNLTDDQKRFTAICYMGSTPDAPQQEAGFASGGEIVGTNPDGSVMVDLSGVPQRIDPQELCGALWSEAPLEGQDQQSPGSEPPAMVTCIRDDWRYAVFATPDGLPANVEQFCEAIDMKPGTIDVTKL